MASLSTGFVYVLNNEFMPGLVKIGFSTRLPEDRAKELRTTGVPGHFKVVHRALVSDPQSTEKKVHEILATHRRDRDREFFQIGVDEAINAVEQARIVVSGIERWTTSSRIALKNDDRLALTLSRDQIFVVMSWENPIMQPRPSIQDLWQAHSDGDVLELLGSDNPQQVAGLSTNDENLHSDPIPYLSRAQEAPNGRVIGKERLDPGQRLLWLDGKIDPCSMVVLDIHCYCQIICRTWTPKVSEIGLPRILNDFLFDQLPLAMAEKTHTALYHPPPRVWAPEYKEHGTNPPGAEYWLPQLAKQSKPGNWKKSSGSDQTRLF